MLPFGDIIDVSYGGKFDISGQILNFSQYNNYSSLYYDELRSLFSNVTTRQGNIYLLNKNFGFIDVSNDVFVKYNQITVSDAGWLTYYNYDILSNVLTPLLVLRFFPFPVNSISYKYTIINNTFGYTILEIIANGKDKNNIPFQITIHIYDFGLITLCNGDGNKNLYNPGNLKYSEADQDLLTIVTPDVKFYLPIQLEYTYDYSSNAIITNMYDILRFDLRNSEYDPNTGIYKTKGLKTAGYLVGELKQYYSLKELSEGYTASCLRNVGYTAKDLYDISGSSYSIFNIVTSFNINIGIPDILNYQ
jgi:hypothetical protein